MPHPIDRDTLRAVLQAVKGQIAAGSLAGPDDATPASQHDVTILAIKLLIVTGLRIAQPFWIIIHAECMKQDQNNQHCNQVPFTVLDYCGMSGESGGS